jgi:hypothetical protein
VEVDKYVQNCWLNNKNDVMIENMTVTVRERESDAETLASVLSCRVVKWLNWVNQEIVNGIITIINYSQQDATFLEFISTDALLVSGGFSAHHQEQITVHTASRIIKQYCC